ncbi:hypothetical protein GCM10011591_47850 [Nocardia camponoti]|uniref:Uncharacterized protein n=1 Tax=Nocardia camponoti TaxID=1616106 RepID=A0A917QVF3_9NOCA|nr:hypothetical protein GCM10011591_47850 [Nocardia camponoti]
MPMPAILFATVDRPSDDMGDTGRDLVIAAWTPVRLDRTSARNRANHIVIAGRTRLSAPKYVANGTRCVGTA